MEASERTIDLLVQNTDAHNFLRIPQSTFPTLPSTLEMESSRSYTQTMTSSASNIVETFVLIPFVEAPEMTIDLLVQNTDVHNFLRIRKVRFERYRPQLKWNQAVLLLKQWCRLFLKSLKLSFKYHLKKPQNRLLIYKCKRLMFTIFCGFCKVRFQRYRPQLKWNQAVLLLKQWCRLLLTSLKLSFKYHL